MISKDAPCDFHFLHSVPNDSAAIADAVMIFEMNHNSKDCVQKLFAFAVKCLESASREMTAAQYPEYASKLLRLLLGIDEKLGGLKDVVIDYLCGLCTPEAANESNPLFQLPTDLQKNHWFLELIFDLICTDRLSIASLMESLINRQISYLQSGTIISTLLYKCLLQKMLLLVKLIYVYVLPGELESGFVLSIQRLEKLTYLRSTMKSKPIFIQMVSLLCSCCIAIDLKQEYLKHQYGELVNEIARFVTDCVDGSTSWFKQCVLENPSLVSNDFTTLCQELGDESCAPATLVRADVMLRLLSTSNGLTIQRAPRTASEFHLAFDIMIKNYEASRRCECMALLLFDILQILGRESADPSTFIKPIEKFVKASLETVCNDTLSPCLRLLAVVRYDVLKLYISQVKSMLALKEGITAKSRDWWFSSRISGTSFALKYFVHDIVKREGSPRLSHDSYTSELVSFASFLSNNIKWFDIHAPVM